MIDIILPTYKRHTKLEELTKHIIETAGHPFKLYYVADSSDQPTLETVQKLSENFPCVNLLICPHKGSAAAQDWGYRHSDGEYVFTGGDDHEYPKDFLRRALVDIGENPVLAIADSETHTWCIFMYKRSYVKEHSLVEDMPDSIMYHGYNRIADSELVFTMQNRGKLSYATFTVKHINPGLYGVKRVNPDGSETIEMPEYAIHDLRIPESTIHTEIVAHPLTGLKNVLRVLVIPKAPIVVDENYSPYNQQLYEKDCVVMLSRCHLWGGRTHHEKWYKE